jgi:hypothetical protein
MMKVWHKPMVYVTIHILTGSIAYYYPTFLFFILAYHLLQYGLNVRFFIFQWKLGKGNSIEHTVVKLLEVLLGYLLASIIQ